MKQDVIHYIQTNWISEKKTDQLVNEVKMKKKRKIQLQKKSSLTNFLFETATTTTTSATRKKI